MMRAREFSLFWGGFILCLLKERKGIERRTMDRRAERKQTKAQNKN
jgi:hypothetical protein